MSIRQSRNKFILVFMLLSGSFLALAQTDRPNILLILTDDLGINDLGCYGNDFYETPHIDRLSTEGMKFNHHYSAGAVCSPTRTSIITGKFPARTHSTEVYNWGIDNEYFNEPLLCEKDKVLSKDQTFLAEVIRKQGYKTAMFGKWHIEGVDPKESGFDESLVNHNTTQKNKDANDDEFHIDKITELTQGFIERSVKSKKPFFVVASHHSIHVPQSASTKSREYFERKGGLPEWENRPDFQTPVYAGMMKDLDDGVGRLLKTLDELKIAENTIVLFTSDNGGLYERNLPHRGGKADQYEGGIRVPLIVRWPEKVKAGSSTDGVVVSSDYFRTLSSIVETTLDKKTAPDSEDFTPLLLGNDQQRMPIIFHFPHYRGKDGDSWLRPWSVVRAGDFTYVYHWEADLTPDLARGIYVEHELYNVVDDPKQQTNLVDTQEDVADSLRSYLLTWLKENKAQMPKVNADYFAKINNSFDSIKVGAIRWDAWFDPDKGGAAQEVEYALSQQQYHWRAPFFSKIASDTSIRILGYDQEVLDQEIDYAAEMGLDYWAFLLYDEDTPLNDGLKYYLSSEKKGKVKFCAMINPQRNFSAKEGAAGIEGGIDRLITYFGEESYQLVDGNRPLLFFFRPDELWVTAMGGQTKVEEMLQLLESKCRETGLGAPYIVVMNYKQKEGLAMANLLQADALSAYATHGDQGATGKSYANLTRQTEEFWERYREKGRQVVPTVMTGWDRRPRIERPMSWEKEWQQPGDGMELYFDLPTNGELIHHFKQASDWLHDNSLEQHPKIMLVYAWNEHDEGGWLCPTLDESGGVNASRMQALKRVLK